MRRFNLLGPLLVERDGVDLTPEGAKQQLVLTVLILARGRVVPVDRLIELVWAGRPPAAAPTTLRSYVSNIRRSLEPERSRGARDGLVRTRSPGYLLDIGRDVVDVNRFEDGVEAASALLTGGDPVSAADRVEAALGLWRSVDLADSPLRLVAGEAARLMELRSLAVDLGHEARLAAGRHAEAIPDLRRVVEAEPWRHRARGLLMLALHRAGRSAEAVRVHRAGVEAAIEATGIGPPAQLADLERRILSDDPTLAWRPPAPGRPASHILASGHPASDGPASGGPAPGHPGSGSPAPGHPASCGPALGGPGSGGPAPSGLAAGDAPAVVPADGSVAGGTVPNRSPTSGPATGDAGRPRPLATGAPDTVARSALAQARARSAAHDHGGAIDLVERGLTVLGPAGNPAIRADLLLQLATEHKHQEHHARAHQAARAAFDVAERAGDLDRMIAAALTYCGEWSLTEFHGLYWLGYWNPPGPALDLLDRCLARVPPVERRVVLLMAYGAQLFGPHDAPGTVDRVLTEAVSLARRTGSDELTGAALQHDLTIRQRRLSLAERSDRAGESLAIATRAGLAERELAARRSLLVLALDQGRPDEAEEHRRAAARLVGEGSGFPAMLAGSMGTALFLLRGDLDAAERDLTAALDRFSHLGAAGLDVLGIQLAVLRREQGRLDEVQDLLAWKLAGYPGPAYGAALALVKAEAGGHGEAKEILDAYSEPSVAEPAEGIMQFTVLHLQAEAALAAGLHERLDALRRALGPAAGRIVAAFDGMILFGSGSLTLGRLATALGDLDAAATLLADADRHHRAIGSTSYLIRTLVARADLARLRRRPGDATRLEREAADLAAGTPLVRLLQLPGRAVER